MFKQLSIDKTTILGLGNVSRIAKPRLIGSNKKNPPDMSSTVPYFPALSGKTLSIGIDGDVTATYNITFTGNSMTQALSDINTVTTTNVTASDVSGYLLLTCEHAGNRNLIKILSGTSLSILGFEQDPHPASISYAGEIDSLPTVYENRLKGSVPILNNELISREVLNRLSAGVSYVLDTLFANLEKEIALPKEYTVTMAGTSFTIPSDDRFFLNVDNLTTPNPSQDSLENAVTILDSNNNLVFDSNGNRVRVSSITYGPLVDATSTFASWGTPDGKSVFGGLTHWQKQKSTRTITSITGNTIKCTGASFVTDKVQPNDIVVISSATNLTPFNPNGEYTVDEVINNEIIKVRPKSTLESTLISSFTPSCLNNVKQLGESYGTLTVYLGKFCPMQMKGANMTFTMSASLTGNYKVVLPVGRTTKTLVASELPRLLAEPTGGQIELGSKLLSTLANALKPRIIAKPNADTSKTYLMELKNGTVGLRFYSLLAGGLEIVYNGKWDGTSYIKDDMTKDIFYLKQNVSGMSIGSDTLNVNLDQATGKIIETYVNYVDFYDGVNTVLSIPKYDGTVASNIVAKSGIRLGTGFTSDTPALVPKIEYTVNTGANKYTLLSETLNSGARKRIYVLANGTYITTLNAKWNGTQWIKDTAAFSQKHLNDTDSFYNYNHSSTTTPFADTDWTNKEELKSYTLNENFSQRIGKTTDAANRQISSFSVFSTPTNTQSFSSVVLSSGTLGELSAQATAVGTFNTTYNAATLEIPSASDFDMNIRANCSDRSILSAFDSLNPEGLLFGNWDAITGNTRMLLRAASDKTNWQIQVVSTVTDTGISSNSYITVQFKRRAGTLTVYVNNSLIYTVLLTGVVRLLPEITFKGTASGTNQDIFQIDYFKVWVGMS